MIKVLASIALLLALNSVASAQVKKAPPEKPSPRPIQPVPAPKTAQPPGAADQPFVPSPWVKFCGKDSSNPAARPVCLTIKEAFEREQQQQRDAPPPPARK